MKNDTKKSENLRAYAKGYAAGSRRAWPEHRPPMPPAELLHAFVLASRELRDEADQICCWLDEDDDFAKMLAPKIAALDTAMESWASWLKTDEEPTTPTP